jgi:mRNA interferase MazF
LKPSRGEVWLVGLDATKGREQQGTRPALVVSVDKFNEGPADLVVIIPITTTDRGIASHVGLAVNKSGLSRAGFAMTEQVRCISKARFIKLYGTVDSKTMSEVGYSICAILGL